MLTESNRQLYPVVLKVSTYLNLKLLCYDCFGHFVDDDSSSVPMFGGMSRAKRKPVLKKGQLSYTYTTTR